MTKGTKAALWTWIICWILGIMLMLLPLFIATLGSVLITMIFGSLLTAIGSIAMIVFVILIIMNAGNKQQPIQPPVNDQK